LLWAVDSRADFFKWTVYFVALVRDTLYAHQGGSIMDFAGSIIVPESVENPLKYYKNNTAASRSLIESAVVCGVPHFIFSSTATLYGIVERWPIGEDFPLQPINPYGKSKLMTEQMLADVAAAYPLSYGVLRYFNVAGADPQGRSGQSTEGATHLIKVAVEAATGKRDHVAVFGTDYDTRDGTGMRDYIHVSDLAAAHVDTLEALMANPGTNYTMNVGYGTGSTVLEVLDAVDRVTNMTIERRIEPRRAGDPPILVADNRAILATLPWRPKRDELDTIIADALAWERKLAERAEPVA
jgi:UDP-glucose 4-epimerase